MTDDLQSAPSNLDHVSIISFNKFNNPFDKVSAYKKCCDKYKFDHICWVAPIQNFSLYMGMQLAPCQSYWSMKYHSIIMPTIQKYAGLGFGGESFKFDDKEWFRGRAFPDLRMPGRDEKAIVDLKKSNQIPVDGIVVGCFVRAEKLLDDVFWNSICKILLSSDKVHFLIASQSIPNKYTLLLKTLPLPAQKRFHHLGWVNTKQWAYALDLYYDSFPRGSCNTIFECIEAGVPVLMADTDHNRESSALPYLVSASKYAQDQRSVPGVFSHETMRLKNCLNLLSSKSSRKELSSRQIKLLNNLQGQNYLFAKDYLNYFLDGSLSLSRLK